MIWLWILSSVYVLGAVFTVVLMVLDAKRTNERWPWQAYPIAFLLWWSFMLTAAVVVHRQAKEANR